MNSAMKCSSSAGLDPGFDERVKLLLWDVPAKNSEPKNLWPKRCPEYFVSAFWWAFFVASVIALLVLFVLTMVNEYEDKVAKRPIYVAQVVEPGSPKGHRPKEDDHRDLLSSMLESSNNVFFLMNRPLNWRSSCSLESILSRMPDKNIFLLTFSHDPTDGRFEKKLRAEYSTLMMLKVDGEQFFKGSMFDGDWKGDERSLREAKLLTVWQFGGTVMSNDVIEAGKLPRTDGSTCLVSPDLISCPTQCSAYLYQLILTGKESGEGDLEEIVQKSVKEFCGNPAACPGVQRLPSTCSVPNHGCLLVKLPSEVTPSNDTWSTYRHFCPLTYITFQYPDAQC